MAKTEIQRLIVENWFLTAERLAKESGVSPYTVEKAIHGEKILRQYEEQLRRFLEKL